ncbi:MAG: hypothetical protein ACREPR_04520 [Brasilonema sp.]
MRRQTSDGDIACNATDATADELVCGSKSHVKILLKMTEAFQFAFVF